jgi:hypothetical protein
MNQADHNDIAAALAHLARIEKRQALQIQSTAAAIANAIFELGRVDEECARQEVIDAASRYFEAMEKPQ